MEAARRAGRGAYGDASRERLPSGALSALRFEWPIGSQLVHDGPTGVQAGARDRQVASPNGAESHGWRVSKALARRVL
jgi:hypothetical protein